MTKQVNKAGRSIWFVPSRDGGGTYHPVSRSGWVAATMAVAWILVCATAGMAGFVLTWDRRWFVAMFAAAAVGLAMFAAAVIRHS